MKLSHILKKMRLYKPAKGFADSLSCVWVANAARFKHLVYRRTVKHETGSDESSRFGPRVLVVMNSGGIGNSIEATPLVEAIRTLWRRAVITIVAPPGDLFKNWCVPDTITDSPEDVKGWEFDHTFFPYAFYNDIAGWKRICNLGEVHCMRVWLGKFFLKPEREYMLDMLKPFGHKNRVPPLYVSVRKPETELPSGAVRICLVPGAKSDLRWRHKRWSEYGALAKALAARHADARVYVIGKSEDSFDEEVLCESGITDLRDRLSLAETAWVLKHSDLVIGNDCGPMHIAYAVGTPSVVIFGPTCEIKNAPTGKAVALSVAVSCRPCQYTDMIENCDDPLCMKEVSLELVMEKAEQILSESNRK